MSPTCLPILTSAVPQDKFFIPAAWSGSWTHHTVSASAVNPTPWRRLSPAFLSEQTFLIYRSLRHLSSHFHSPRAKRDSKRARESEVYLWTPKQASLCGIMGSPGWHLSPLMLAALLLQSHPQHIHSPCGTVWSWDCPPDILLFPTWFSAQLPCSALVYHATWWHKITLGNSGVRGWLKDLTDLHSSELHLIRSESISVSKGKDGSSDTTLSNVWTSHRPLSENLSECCHISQALLFQFITNTPPSLSGL